MIIKFQGRNPRLSMNPKSQKNTKLQGKSKFPRSIDYLLSNQYSNLFIELKNLIFKLMHHKKDHVNVYSRIM